MVASPLKAVSRSGLPLADMPLDASPRAPRGPPTAKPARPTVAKASPYITPRLAGSSASSPDLGRKPLSTTRVQTTTPKRDSPSPVKGTRSGNATPLSAPRRTRTGSTSSTPNGTPGATPTSSRPTSIIATKAARVDRHTTPAGIGIQGVGLRPNSRPGSIVGTTAGGPHLRNLSPERSVPDRQESPGTQGSTTFFHANDGPSIARTPAVPPTQPKAQAFFYANGRLETPSSPQEDQPARTGAAGPAKFFHANGQPNEERWSAGSRQTPLSSTSRAPRLANFPPPTRTTTARSTSPLRESETPPPPPHKSFSHESVSASTVPAVASLASRSRPMSMESPLETLRSGSTGNSTTSMQHRKSQSTSTLESPLSLRLTAMNSNTRVSDASSSFVSEPDSIEQQPLEVAIAPSVTTPSPLVSPTRSILSPTATFDAPPQSKLEQAQALAAQARRERKVLDLEISNSSLMAINRTLEREMRKQKAELRRYRRLTSSGRMSLLPNEPAARTASQSSNNQSGLSPIEGSEDEAYETSEDDDDEFSSESPSPSSDSASSPDHDSETAARRRAKDARRLRLDLARHKSLLADSQALNQSLKRCLGRTEALISEGKRALDHKVRVSEVHLGGRVLDVDEVGEDVELDEHRHGLLSPGLEADGDEAQGYRWTQAPSESGPASPMSPMSPFSGFMPFVRQATKAFGDMTGSPERRQSPSPTRMSPTRERYAQPEGTGDLSPALATAQAQSALPD